MANIITFYSYKGGTGRTMALANTACLLAKKGKSVLMIDWDLEAPGLPKYFEQNLSKSSQKKGLIDFFEEARKNLPKMARNKEDEHKLNKLFAKIKDYTVQIDIGQPEGKLFLLPAGNYEADENEKRYSNQIRKFNWSTFYDKIPAFFTFFADYLKKEYDYILIDSRTGHTDISGICTMLLPDKLVLVFTPNKQSIEGVIRVARKVADFRIGSPYYNNPLLMYPLPSRIDLEIPEEQERWRMSYIDSFEKLFQDIYDLPNTISLNLYFNTVQIRHSAKYAYGEEVAALNGADNDPNSIHNAFLRFTQQLISNGDIWEDKPFEGLTQPLSLFFIYSQEDEKRYYRELVTALFPIQRQRVIKLPNESNVPVEHWSGGVINTLYESSDIIVILITPSLLKTLKDANLSSTNGQEVNADKTYKNWIAEIEELDKNPLSQKLIFPILLENSDWKETYLNQIPIYPARSSPLQEATNTDEWWQETIAAFNEELTIFASSLNTLSS